MPSISRKLTALGITAALGLGAATVPAAGLAKATTTGKHTVTVKSVYVYHAGPAKVFDGTMFKGNTFKVERFSPSGKWAYGMAYGHVNRHAWIDASVLTRKES